MTGDSGPPTAFLFAGQGAQKVGMGKRLAEGFPAARALFDAANDLLGYDLSSICFQGPEELLTQTENAQPAIFLVSWVALCLLRQELPRLSPVAAAGLSLGEFTALTAAGVWSFDQGLRVVRDRGRFMQEACELTKGGMAAVLGLDEAVAGEVCEQAGVEIANLNCPGQIVISGETDGIERACRLAVAKGAKRAMPLTVAGAYHSRLMESAGPKLAALLPALTWNPARMPVISNVTALPHGSAEETAALLVQQVTSPVRWEQSMRHILSLGVTRFVEFGPGTVLSGFLKRTAPGLTLLNIEDVPSLERALKVLGS